MSSSEHDDFSFLFEWKRIAKNNIYLLYVWYVAEGIEKFTVRLVFSLTVRLVVISSVRKVLCNSRYIEVVFFVSLFHHYHYHQYHKSLSSSSFSLSPDLMFLPLAVAAQAQEITLKPCKNMDYLYKSINNFGTLSDHLPCFLS